MSTAAQILICLFSEFILFFYFDNKYKSTSHGARMTLIFASSFTMLVFSSYFKSQNVIVNPWDVLIFPLSAVAVAVFGYETSKKEAISDALGITVLKICADILTQSATEVLYYYRGSYISSSTPLFLIKLTVGEILFFSFVTAYLKLGSAKTDLFRLSKASSALFLFPFISLAIITALVISSKESGFSGEVNTLFIVISLLLLCANAVLFGVYEKTVKILKKNGEYAIAARQEALELSHYEELKRNKEASDKLVHEIKNHLSTVKALARDGNSTEISDYVESVLSDGDFEYSKEYSRNKLVNIIVSRYAQLSKASGIVFDADIRDVSFDGLKESELTSLLDNILKNAYEGALRSFEKRIAIRIELKNEIVLKIYAENSCDEAPAFCGNTLVSSKPDKKSHGYGTKIITKTAESHGGTASFSFDEEEKLFKCTVVMLR